MFLLSLKRRCAFHNMVWNPYIRKRLVSRLKVFKKRLFFTFKALCLQLVTFDKKGNNRVTS